MKAKLASYGVHFVTGDVVGFSWQTILVPSVVGTVQKRSKLIHVHVQSGDGRVHPVKFGLCLNATGAEAQNIARLAGIGVGEEALSFDLPIMSRFLFTHFYINADFMGVFRYKENVKVPYSTGA